MFLYQSGTKAVAGLGENSSGTPIVFVKIILTGGVEIYRAHPPHGSRD
jgi:hypothetical protein